MIDDHKDIFDACNAQPPILCTIKSAYEHAKMKKKVIDAKTGNTPLHLALEKCADLEVIEFLCSTDEDMVKSANYKRLLPMHIACNGPESSVLVVSFLVEQWKGSLQMCTGLGNLPLHVACASRAPMSVVRCLLEQYGGAQNTLNRYKQTPLDLAMSEDKKPAHTHVVKFLGGDPNLIDMYNGEMINEDNRITEENNPHHRRRTEENDPHHRRRRRTNGMKQPRQKSPTHKLSSSPSSVNRSRQMRGERGNGSGKSIKRMVTDTMVMAIPKTVRTRSDYGDMEDDTSVSMEINSSYLYNDDNSDNDRP